MPRGGRNWKSDENRATRGGSDERCDVCGGSFYVAPSQKDKRSTCSKPCKAKKESKVVWRKCKNCRKKFPVKAHDVCRGRGLYCCTACYGEHRRKQAKKRRREKEVKYDSACIE